MTSSRADYFEDMLGYAEAILTSQEWLTQSIAVFQSWSLSTRGSCFPMLPDPLSLLWVPYVAESTLGCHLEFIDS